MKALVWLMALLMALVAGALMLPGGARATGALAQTAALAAITATVQVGPNGALVFSPTTQIVAVGDTVHWVWASNFHSTTAGTCANSNCTHDPLLWDSGVHNVNDPPGPPHSFDVTFNTPGSYSYFCSIHGPSFGMRGTILVASTRVHLPLVVR